MTYLILVVLNMLTYRCEGGSSHAYSYLSSLQINDFVVHLLQHLYVTILASMFFRIKSMFQNCFFFPFSILIYIPQDNDYQLQSITTNYKYYFYLIFNNKFLSTLSILIPSLSIMTHDGGTPFHTHYDFSTTLGGVPHPTLC